MGWASVAARKPRWLLLGLFGLQLGCVAGLLWLPVEIWFLLGLHLIGLYLFILVVGILCAATVEQWRWLFLQVGFLPAAFFLFRDNDVNPWVGPVGRGIVLGLFLLAGLYEAIRMRQTPGAGHCLRCGYDLRGTLAARRTECPECGARVAGKAHAAGDQPA